MNENQEMLYKALRIIADSSMELEETLAVIEKMSKKEVKEVVDKFDSVVTEWNINYMYDNSYNFEYFANGVIGRVERKLREV